LKISLYKVETESQKFLYSTSIYTVLHYASMVYAVVMCLSVTSQCSPETAKRRIMQTMPHGL